MNLVEYRHSRLDMAAAEGGYDLLVASLPPTLIISAVITVWDRTACSAHRLMCSMSL